MARIVVKGPDTERVESFACRLAETVEWEMEGEHSPLLRNSLFVYQAKNDASRRQDPIPRKCGNWLASSLS
ncbi:MAG: hypothetical protein NZV14_04410 [Bryobacteraceae bacterium]|nr:hypothetical protein [Bryobacteraceae bacterium]MDW8377376.1 hypothetical protein [Bryobacterales bacterium]